MYSTGILLTVVVNKFLCCNLKKKKNLWEQIPLLLQQYCPNFLLTEKKREIPQKVLLMPYVRTRPGVGPFLIFKKSSTQILSY